MLFLLWFKLTSFGTLWRRYLLLRLYLFLTLTPSRLLKFLCFLRKKPTNNNKNAGRKKKYKRTLFRTAKRRYPAQGISLLARKFPKRFSKRRRQYGVPLCYESAGRYLREQTMERVETDILPESDEGYLGQVEGRA